MACHSPYCQRFTHSTEMTRLIHPLLVLLVRATEKELVLYLEYLKAENRILRSRLPKRVEVTPAENTGLSGLGYGGARPCES